MKTALPLRSTKLARLVVNIVPNNTVILLCSVGLAHSEDESLIKRLPEESRYLSSMEVVRKICRPSCTGVMSSGVRMFLLQNAGSVQFGNKQMQMKAISLKSELRPNDFLPPSLTVLRFEPTAHWHANCAF